MFKLPHFVFSAFYFALILWGFNAGFPLWLFILSSLIFLFLWKFLGGLAWHNFFILFSLMLFLYVNGLFFDRFLLLPLIGYLWVLFYLSALKFKKYPYLYDFTRNIFLASVLFLFFTSLNILLFRIHISIWLITLFLAIGSALFVYWKILIDRLNMDFLNSLILFLGFLEVSFFLFNLSGGFFICPILSVFWFYTLFDILEAMDDKNIASKFNLWYVLIPLAISLGLIFWVKI